MRLQLTILRNGLAPIRNVFNTTSRQFASEKIVLVSDLLHVINQTIQLEDDDNWGFEDYIVETRLNDNQTESYELFHYQALEDVLKEDDEVTIRPLSSSEIKQRERGGRYQINAGGMHLIDGSPWGRGFAAGRSRPRISIPPRRRSAALDGLAAAGQIGGMAVEEEGLLEDVPAQLQIEDTPRVATIMQFENADEEEEEEDEDFTEGSDSEDDDDDDLEADDSEYDIERVIDGSKELLAELASDLEQPNPTQLERVDGATIGDLIQHDSRKRKRQDRLHQGRHTKQRMEATTHNTSVLSKHERDTVSNVRRTGNPVDERAVHFGNIAAESSSEDESDYEDDTSSSDGSDPDSEVEAATVEPGTHGSEKHTKENDPSSDSSDSESDEDSSTLPEVPRVSREMNGVSIGAETSDTSSDSESESDSSSSSDSSDSSSDEDSSDSEDGSLSSAKSSVEGATVTKSTKAKATMSHSIGQKPTGTVLTDDTTAVGWTTSLPLEPKPKPSQPTVAPGQGMRKTQSNNNRKKRSKHLAQLKLEGILPPDANFAMLQAYLDGNEITTSSILTQELVSTNSPEQQVNDAADTEALDTRRREMLAKLNEQDLKQQPPEKLEVDPIPTDPVVASDYPVTAVTQSLQTSPKGESNLPSKEQSTSVSVAMTKEQQELPSKRARLDVAGSRRILFGALGVRNPKTPAAEQALREKLSKPSREIKPREPEEEVSIKAAAKPKSQDRWKSKLIITAVECVNKKKNIEIPPFPFKHPWQVRKEKDQGIYQEDEQSFYADDIEDVIAANTQPQEPLPKENSQAFTTSRTLTTGSQEVEQDDIPIPSDFSGLFDLQQTDVVIGAVIAYKELHLDEHYQPTQSPYRVGKILSKDNQIFRLQLANEYRDVETATYDEETGERVYSKLDMPIENDDMADDGVRELTFQDLINPKFVSPSDSAEKVVASQVSGTESPQKAQSAGQDSSLPVVDDSHVSESIRTELEEEISISRRAEINDMIKDAGFDSALDDQLLQTLSEEGQHSADSRTESMKQTELTQTSQTEKVQGTSQALLTSQDSDWISTSENVFSTPIGPQVDAGPEHTSSLSESMVESVRYPNLSQLEVTPMPPSADLQSSSHQDAQRLTPTPAETSGLAVTFLSDVPTSKQVSQAEDSMPSVIPETQANEAAADGRSDVPMSNDFHHEPSPIRTFDGAFSPPRSLNKADTSFRDHNDSSDEIDKLPSIRSLTSSQVRKINGHRRADSTDTNDAKSKSSTRSRTTRRSPRIGRYNGQDDLDLDDISETESPNSSSRLIKTSASQREKTRPSLSQVPEDTIIVDLTQSSPAASPQNRAATREGRKSTRTSTGSSTAFKKAFEGLGERNVLKRKKKSL